MVRSRGSRIDHSRENNSVDAGQCRRLRPPSIIAGSGGGGGAQHSEYRGRNTIMSWPSRQDGRNTTLLFIAKRQLASERISVRRAVPLCSVCTLATLGFRRRLHYSSFALPTSSGSRELV